GCPPFEDPSGGEPLSSGDRAFCEVAGQVVEALFHLGQTTSGGGSRASRGAREGTGQAGVVNEVEDILDEEFLQRLGLDGDPAAALVPRLFLAHVTPGAVAAARGAHGRTAATTAQHPGKQLDHGTAAAAATGVA